MPAVCRHNQWIAAPPLAARNDRAQTITALIIGDGSAIVVRPRLSVAKKYQYRSALPRCHVCRHIQRLTCIPSSSYRRRWRSTRRAASTACLRHRTPSTYKRPTISGGATAPHPAPRPAPYSSYRRRWRSTRNDSGKATMATAQSTAIDAVRPKLSPTSPITGAVMPPMLTTTPSEIPDASPRRLGR